MNWNHLKNYRCPKDNEPLKDIGSYHACTKCIFSINKQRFDEIVSEQHKPKKRYVTFEDNLSALNNLGRKEIVQDFL